tara:strand:+ start:1074 stop:2456 length:1383 start_codon:yes stop_codon:yes gene_type:complete
MVSYAKVGKLPELEAKGWAGHFTSMRKDPLGTMEQAAAMGDIVRLRFGPIYAYGVFHPAHAQHVLVQNVHNYEKQTRGYAKLRLLLGNGLVTSEGDFWKRQRRIAQPAFHRERIAGFVETMAKATDDLAKRWTQAAGPSGLHTNVSEDMMKLTLRIAGETLCSLDISKDADRLGGSLKHVLEHFHWLTNAPFPFPEYMPTLGNLRFWRSMRNIEAVIVRIIEERRRSPKVFHDLLSMYMEAVDEETGEKMNDRQLIDEAKTVLGAGYETTAVGLSWTLYILSQHPQVAERLAEEATSVLGDRLPTPEDVPKLVYASQVFREAMRLYPPVWAFARRAKEDDVIGGFDIPKGSIVFVGIRNIHRHADYWEHPLTFDPERFSPEQVEARRKLPSGRLAFMPFIAGQRKCIGDHFALTEGAIVLAMLGQRFRFERVPGAGEIIPEPRLSLRPKDSRMPMLIRTR